MKREELTPIDLECNMGPDVNGVVHREPWKAYDIDEVDLLLDDKDAEIEKLKAIRKVHVEAIASMEAELHQNGKEIRRLQRALWLARAEVCCEKKENCYNRALRKYNKDEADYLVRKSNFWQDWEFRLLKIAEKFKEAK